MIDTERLVLLPNSETPEWFSYPNEFIRIVETGLVLFRPWKILAGPYVLSRMSGLRERFPGRELVPFALRLDCDDVACWERGSLPKVVIIHDFASPGWEQTALFETSWDWFRSAIEDFIGFEP